MEDTQDMQDTQDMEDTHNMEDTQDMDMVPNMPVLIMLIWIIITWIKPMVTPIMLLPPITKTLLLKHTIATINMHKMDQTQEVLIQVQVMHNHLEEDELLIDNNYIPFISIKTPLNQIYYAFFRYWLNKKNCIFHIFIYI